MRAIALALCLVAATSVLAAQDNDKTSSKTKVVSETVETVQQPVHYYKLNFVIEELGADRKPINSRTYSTVVSTDPKDQDREVMRTGSRVPIATGSIRSQGADGKLDYQYQYIDVGVNIATRHVRDVDNQLAFHLDAEVSRLADSSPSVMTAAQTDPVIRQNAWQASVIIPIGKPTVVFTSEALDSKEGMQLVVTATPLQ